MTAKINSELEHKLKAHLAPGAYLTTTGRKMVMEVMEVETGQVWMSTEAVTLEYFENLQLEAGLTKVGAASASMDCAGFQHSPGREDEPVLQRIIDGRIYINGDNAIASGITKGERPTCYSSNKEPIIKGLKIGPSDLTTV